MCSSKELDNDVNINIYGEGVEDIPTRDKRNKYIHISRDDTNTGKIKITEVESGEYIGLSVDGNKRFILDREY